MGAGNVRKAAQAECETAHLMCNLTAPTTNCAITCATVGLGHMKGDLCGKVFFGGIDSKTLSVLRKSTLAET